jgi:hypothetical protein
MTTRKKTAKAANAKRPVGRPLGRGGALRKVRKARRLLLHEHRMHWMSLSEPDRLALGSAAKELEIAACRLQGVLPCT